jgi:hypothetical protein
MDEVQLIFEYGTDSLQVYGIYSFRNPGSEIIVVPQSDSGEISFIQFPEGAFSSGFEPTQDSESFMPTDNGFALPPSENAYQLIAFASLTRADEIDFSQTFSLPVSSITIFTPVGVKLENERLTDLGVQTIQNFTYQVYQATAVASGDRLDFVISGNPEDATTPARSNTGLLIGSAALGIALILAGLWMYRRDKLMPVEESPEDEFESAEDVMDAIVALDDLHGRKKISDKAYQKKRAELKETLKGMM